MVPASAHPVTVYYTVNSRQDYTHGYIDNGILTFGIRRVEEWRNVEKYPALGRSGFRSIELWTLCSLRQHSPSSLTGPSFGVWSLVMETPYLLSSWESWENRDLREQVIKMDQSPKSKQRRVCDSRVRDRKIPAINANSQKPSQAGWPRDGIFIRT